MSEETTNKGFSLHEEPEPGSGRLIAALGLAGFLSGLILVSAYVLTLPVIQANKAQALREAIYRVLPGCKTYQTLEWREGRLVAPEDAENASAGPDAKRIYAGYDDSGSLIGFAIANQEPGFQDIIAGIFGYDPDREIIVGFEVLESKETPGLGDKIIKDPDFRANFQALAVEPSIVAVKKGEKKNPHEVEAITGATISSKAVVRLLGNGLAEWREAMENYRKEHQND